MARDARHSEIAACLAGIERMIERLKLLTIEFDRHRKAGYPGSAASLEHAVSFPELRALDRLGKDALERALPGHPRYAENYYVNENTGFSSPEDLLDEFLKKRQIMLTALHVLDAEEAGMTEDQDTSEYGLPKEYRKIADSVRLFLGDHARKCDDYDRNVFIMTRFQPGNKSLEILDGSIRNLLTARGFVGHRADDRVYPNDRNLWDNVCTYMFGCKFGIAVLEDIIANEFNPNVALEYGFMRALGKPTLLLKEQRFHPRADILGTVWEEFDILDIEKTVHSAIDRWLRDLDA
jgi:hypothetical protein